MRQINSIFDQSAFVERNYDDQVRYLLLQD